ncbi:SGNH/GDSL hydrolase family protein [Ruegeria arenilitoris]|uniref:SGNH/GDSL hydrolase family protein n=1 Tax=Ruegeria arenilitoris TaxID=1173585 RepID=UPI00147AA7B2|nr:GDSL-type esterase/lipase family protein [Ruegeria arenilitoris]
MAKNKPTKHGNLIVRSACLISGLGLCIWALSDHPSIGGGAGFGLFQSVVLIAGLITMAAAFLPTRAASTYFSVFVATILSLVAVEILLQVMFRPNYFTSYQYDDRLLFQLKPGSSGVLTHPQEFGGATVLYQVNTDGFVGPELRDPPAEFRVLVYGDSFIHANYTPFDERFTSVLQKDLTEKLAVDSEVINAGISGYGPDQILRRMQTELDQYSPDFVVVSIFSGNDFGDLLRNRMYDLDGDGSLVEREFFLSAEQAREGQLNESELAIVRVLRRTLKALRNSGTTPEQFDPEAWIDWAMARHQEEYKSFVAGEKIVGEFAVDPYSTDIAVSPNSASADLKIRLMDAIIGEISTVAANANVPLLFVVIPHPMDLLDGAHSSGQINKEKYPTYNPKNLTNLLQASVVDHDQEVLNLYPVLKGGDVNDLFLKGGDDHWNAKGQAKSAEAVANEIIRMMN